MAVPEQSKGKVVHGYDASDDRAKPVEASLNSSGKRALHTLTEVSGVASVDLNHTDDEVTVANTSDGGTTRALAKGDTSGRFQIDVERIGNTAPSMDGGRQNTNATLQIADADVSNGNAVPVSDAGGSLTVDQPTASNLNAQVAQPTAANLNAQVQGAAAAGAAVSGNPVLTGGSDGTNARAVRMDTSGNQGTYPKSSSTTISDGASATGAFQQNEDASGFIRQLAIPFLFNGSTYDRARGSTTGAQTIGGLAHDDADTAANRPVKTGARAVAHGASPTAVAADDVTHVIANRHGVPFVIGGHPNVQTRAYRAGTVARTDVALITVGAGTKIVLTSIRFSTHSDTTVSVSLRVGFGTANTPAEPAANATTDNLIIYEQGIVPGDGGALGNGAGIVAVGADNADLRLTCSAPTNGDLSVTYSWYEVPS